MLTPLNRTRLVLSDPAFYANCWIQDSDFPNLQSLVIKYGNAFVDNLIMQACGQVNRITNRWWNIQDADEIFINDKATYLTYETYILKNSPINSIADLYLEINDQFIPISTQFLQIFSAERTFKILPSVFQQQQSPQIFSLVNKTTALNLWIRYNSGYTPANMPFDVKYATALLVSYYASALNNLDGISSFKTQTYAQTFTKPSENPLLLQVKEMLKPYMLFTVR